ELVTQVDRHDAVPELGGDGFDCMAVIARGVVDEDTKLTQHGRECGDAVAQRRNIRQVAAAKEEGWSTRRCQTFDKRRRGRLVDIEEGDARALSAKCLDNRRTDARSAAGDKD